MALTLSKGNVISLKKGVKYAKIGLGWQCGTQNIDLDASAFLLGSNGKCASDDDVVFYGMQSDDKVHVSGAVKYGGDSLSGGDGDEDDETLFFDFEKMPRRVTEVDITVTIHRWKTRNQTFGMVKKAYCRLIATDANGNPDGSGDELRFNLPDDYPKDTAILVAKLIKDDASRTWSFKAVGDGYQNAGLGKLVRDRGLVCDDGDQ